MSSQRTDKELASRATCSSIELQPVFFIPNQPPQVIPRIRQDRLVATSRQARVTGLDGPTEVGASRPNRRGRGNAAANRPLRQPGGAKL